MLISYIAELEVGDCYRIDVWVESIIDNDTDFIYSLMSQMSNNECVWIVPGTITE